MTQANGTLIDAAPGRRPGTDPGGSPTGAPTKDPTRSTFCREATTPEEVYDFISALSEEWGVSAKCWVSRQNPQLGWDFLGAFPASECNIDAIGEKFGPGKYRAVITGNSGNTRRGIAFAVAAPANPAHNDNTPPVGGVSGTANATDLAGIVSQAVAAAVARLAPMTAHPPAASAPGLDLSTLLVTQMQQQGAMLTALISKLTDRPATESPKVSELSELIKLAKQLNGRDETESDDMSQLVELGKGFAAQLMAPRSAPTAPRPRNPRRVVRVTNHADGRGPGRAESKSAAPTLPPAAVTYTHESGAPVDATPVPPHETTVSGTATGHAADDGSTATGGNPLALLLRNDARAQALGVMIHNADDTTDAESFADVAAGVLPPEFRQLVAAGEPGAFAALLAEAFPALAQQMPRLRAVEDALRTMLNDTGEDAGEGETA